MSDYLITMDTGEQFIAHHGVKGMKWGKWNPETQARYADAGNGTYYKKAARGSEYGKSVTDLRREYNANQAKSKQIVKNLLMSPIGAHAYNTARSRGLSRGDAAMNAALGPLYVQGVKHKQKKLGTTTAMVSKAAKERGDSTRDESIAKSVAKQALVGEFGTSAYNTVKARTGSRGLAGAAGLATTLTGPVGAVAAPLLSRSKGYNEQVKASQTRKRAPGEKKGKNLVDEKVSEAKNQSVLQEHQEARKRFNELNERNTKKRKQKRI